MRLPYHILDVFTNQRFGGNPLAVVLDADGLDTDAHADDRARVQPVRDRVRARSRRTRRTRRACASSRRPSRCRSPGTRPSAPPRCSPSSSPPAPSGDGDALIVLEEGIGPVRVGVRLRPGAAPFAEFDAPKLPQESGTLPPADRLAAAVGLIPAEIGFENHRPTRFAAGNTFAFVPVASLEAMAKARVASSHWGTAFQGGIGAFLYCRQTVHNTSAFHARMFAPEHGVPEDPATGSAAVGFAGVVHRFDALPDGLHKRTIEQGFEMGRPSLIELSLHVGGGKLEAVRIGGHAVRVAEGMIEV